MPPSAPLRAVVELRRGAGGARCFRLARAISEEGLQLGVAVPERFDGPLDLTLVLPDDEAPLAARGRLVEVAPDDDGDDEHRPELRAVRFLALDEETRARIARYIQERLIQP